VLVWSRLCSFSRFGLSHCAGGPISKGVGLGSTLLLWTAWDHSVCWRADRQRRCSGLASVLLVGVGSVTVVAGTTGEGDGLASVRLAGVGSVTVVAGTTVEGAGLASVLLVGVGSVC
jgi:hypothetical protein